MQRRSLGASGPWISVLGYGAWITGADTASAVDLGGVERAVRTALDAGINWVDTAEIYAAGASEEIVGRAVRPIRDDVALVTKVAAGGAGSGMRPVDIARAIEGSLRRLDTDRVDLYLLHWHDPAVPLEETWGAMTDLVEKGLARAVGVSNFTEELIRRCLSVAPVHAVQNQMSLLHRDEEALAARLQEEAIPFVAYGSLAFGLLSGRVIPGSALDVNDWRAGRFARYESNYYEELFAPGRIQASHRIARELTALAGATGVPAPVLALRWVLERPGVTAAIVGSVNPQHIRVNARAGDLRLDAETSAAIEAIVERHRRTDSARSPRGASTGRTPTG